MNITSSILDEIIYHEDIVLHDAFYKKLLGKFSVLHNTEGVITFGKPPIESLTSYVHNNMMVSKSLAMIEIEIASNRVYLSSKEEGIDFSAVRKISENLFFHMNKIYMDMDFCVFCLFDIHFSESHENDIESVCAFKVQDIHKNDFWFEAKISVFKYRENAIKEFYKTHCHDLSDEKSIPSINSIFIPNKYSCLSDH